MQEKETGEKALESPFRILGMKSRTGFVFHATPAKDAFYLRDNGYKRHLLFVFCWSGYCSGSALATHP